MKSCNVKKAAKERVTFFIIVFIVHKKGPLYPRLEGSSKSTG